MVACASAVKRNETNRRRAAFLDRDGVINIDRGYVYRREDFDFVPGALDGARRLHDLGYALVVISNQSGIGRGLFSETQFDALSHWMKEKFIAAGAPLSGIYFCPHHPTKARGRYLRSCDCRKPAPGIHGGLPIIGLRFSNVMEPHDYARFSDWQDDPSIRSWNAWGYVDARDTAAACRLALEAELTGADAFIIAAADTVMEGPSRELVAETFPDTEIRHLDGERATLLSIAKARRLLGYEPRHSWQD